MTDAPPNLEALHAIKDPAKQVLAAKAYIEAREKAIDQARGIRDAAIRALLAKHGPTQVATMAQVSVSHVKSVRHAPLETGNDDHSPRHPPNARTRTRRAAT